MCSITPEADKSHKLNNSPENLCSITPSEHMSIHIRKSWEDDYEKRLQTNYIHQNKGSIEFRERCSNGATEQWKKSSVRETMIAQARIGHARLRFEKSREAVRLLLLDHNIAELKSLFKNKEAMVLCSYGEVRN